MKYVAKVSRTYRIEQETADRIAENSDSEGKTATEVVEAAIHAYFSEKYAEKYAGNTASQADSADSPALAALVEQLAVKDAQLAKKDGQIAKLVGTVADSAKAVQGAQALHHETAQTLAIEPVSKKGVFARLFGRG